MLFRILQHPITHIVISTGIVGGVVVCLLPDLIPTFSWVVNYAVQLMLLYLAAGLFMLFLKQPRLTFMFFGGCAILCFFLKYSVKSDGIERWRQNIAHAGMDRLNQPSPAFSEVKIVHINLTNANDPSEVFSVIRSSQADFVSLHEVTPDWSQRLTDSLGQEYIFQHTIVDIGIFGMAIYSRHELSNIDTFYYEEIPNLTGILQTGGHSVRFMSIHTLPALDAFSNRRLREHLEVVRQRVSETEGPVILFGDFNSVAWSNQIQMFLKDTGLLESRAGFMPMSSEGTFSFWDLPLDHIFFSPHFKCSNFENLPGFTGQHLGIAGKYHFPFAIPHVKKISE